MNAPHQVLSCFSCRICDTVAIALVGFFNPLQKGKSRQMGIFQSPPPLKDGETCTLSDEGNLKPSLNKCFLGHPISVKFYKVHIMKGCSKFAPK